MTTPTLKRSWWPAMCVWGTLAAGVLLWVYPLVGRPLLADEIGFVERALWSATAGPPPTMGQPPLFSDALYVCSALWRWSPEQLRWIGVLCLLAQVGLVYAIATHLHPRAGPLAAVLWAIHPMALQGALFLDIDNTVLAVSLSAWCLLWVAAAWPLSRQARCALGLLMGVSLWAKVTTPWVLPLAIVAAGCTQRQGRAAAVDASWITGWALLWFAVTWLGYRWFNAAQPVDIVGDTLLKLGRGFQSAWLPWGAELAARALRLLLWINPVTVLLGWCVWRWGRGSPTAPASFQRSVLWWYVLLVGVGYWIVRGPHYGFAKYHYPMLPVLVALISAGCLERGVLTTRREWGVVLSASVVVGCVYYGAVGDMFSTLHATLRTVLIREPARVHEVVRQLLRQAAAAAAVGVATWAGIQWAYRRAPWQTRVLLSGLVLLLGMHGATDVRQRTTRYATTYNYGRSFPELRTVTQWLTTQASRAPRQCWLAAPEVLFYARVCEYPTSSAVWSVPAILRAALADPRCAGIVVHPLANMVQTYRVVLRDAAVQQLLANRYRRVEVGAYTIWMRRP